jgi:hypothetical protein
LSRRRYPDPHVKRGSCPLRQLGQQYCTTEIAVLVEDRYGLALWGCIPHAAETLRMIPGTTIRQYRRKSDEDELRQWLGGRRP